MPRLPGISYAVALRVLAKRGFAVVREGKHTVLSDGRTIITLPRHTSINAFTMGGIARSAGLTPEEFRKLV